MKKMMTLMLAMIFSINAFASAGYNPEVEKQKYIDETIKRIDKLIESEERNPTPLSEISEKLEKHFVAVDKKQKRALKKLQRLSKRDQIQKINKNIQQLNKMNPMLKLEEVTADNLNQQLAKIEESVSSFDYEPTLKKMNDALATQTSFKDILLQVKNRLLGKGKQNRKTASVDNFDHNLDDADVIDVILVILDVIVSIVIWGGLIVGGLWLLLWAAAGYGPVGIAAVLGGGVVVVLAVLGVGVVIILVSL